MHSLFLPTVLRFFAPALHCPVSPIGGGGALRVYGNSQGLCIRTSFVRNTAQIGGALSFSTNIPNDSPGPSLIEDCLFNENNASMFGGAVGIEKLSAANIRASSFSGNSAVRGGAVSSTTSATVTATNVLFARNAAKENGGSVYAEDTTLIFLNVSLLSSIAGLSGGGLSVSGGCRLG